MHNKLKEWEDNYFTIFDIFAHHGIEIESIEYGRDYIIFFPKFCDIDEVFFGLVKNHNFCNIWNGHAIERTIKRKNTLEAAIMASHIINKKKICRYCVVKL